MGLLQRLEENDPELAKQYTKKHKEKKPLKETPKVIPSKSDK